MAVPMAMRDAAAGPGVASEDRRVWRDHAVAAARPHHGNPGDVGFAALSDLPEHASECLIRKDAREVVDPPLRSVLPTTATTLSAAKVPASMADSMPEASITVFSST